MMKRILAAVPTLVITLFVAALTTPALVAQQCTGWTPTGTALTLPCHAGIGDSGAPPPASLLEVWGSNSPELKITQNPNVAGSSLLTLTPAGLGGIGNVGGIALRNGSPYIYNDAGDSSLINFGSDKIQSHAKFVFNVNTGTLAIGSAYPTWKLEVKHTSSNTTFAGDTGQFGLGLINDSGVVDSWSNISFAQAAYGSVKASIGIQYRAGNVTDFVLATGSAAGVSEKMRITGAGKVGIGVLIPTEMLDVAGNINVSGNINAKYQDVAEWVPADGPIAPGTVVSLDQKRSNRVVPSSVPYDTSVAGVISSKPGIVLGEASNSKVLVATTGRVRVKVDARRFPIRIGDLLVTSAKKGTAMRSEPLQIAGRKIHQPGTLIGKALEPLANGEGEILVLLSLQ